jgi:hypothetical protein
MVFIKSKSLKEIEDFIMTSENRVDSFERSFSEENLENTRFVVPIGFEFSIDHSDLVHVSKEGIHPV